MMHSCFLFSEAGLPGFKAMKSCSVGDALCCPEGANMNELASSLWGIFPPCPTVALFDSQSALPTPHHARRWFPYPHAANTLFPPGCGQASLQAVSFSLWQVFQQNWGKWHVGTWIPVLFSTTATSVTGNFAVLQWVLMSVTISTCITLHNYLLKCSRNLSAVQA